VTVPKSQGHTGNDNTVGVISFSETRINLKKANEMSELGEKSGVKNRHCFCSLVSNEGTNFSEIGCMLKFSLRNCRQVPSDFPEDFINFPHVCKL
jgi:hypothetical protein